MKNITYLIAFLLTCNWGFGQIVSWEMNGNSGDEVTEDATTLDANLNISTLSRGVGINPSSLLNSFSSNNFTIGGTQSDAISNNDYLEFQISTSVGYEVSLSTLDANFRRSSTGPDSFIWRYSTDGVNFVDIGSTIIYDLTSTNGTAQTQIDLSGITALQNVGFGTTLTFRLYGWGATGSTGSFAIGRLAGDDLNITGSVIAVGSCVSTVTWDGTAWSNIIGPDLTTEAVLNESYDTATEGSFSACSLTVNSGYTLTVANGKFVEVQNDVVVDGNLIVETQGNFVQNDDNGSFTLNPGGVARVNKQTPVKAEWYYYTYWSSPVVDETVEDAFPDAPASRRFWFNAANFVDTNGDDIDDNGDDWAIASGTMTPGVGYAATEGEFHVSGGTGTASFEGEFNTGDVPVTITSNPSNTGNNWNLIGNPYASAIDFIAFQQANSSIIDGAAYFWAQASPLDNANSGNQALNFNKNDYATFTVGTGGAAGGTSDVPNGYVASGQGFFIAGLTNGTATFTNAMRMADGTSNSQFFKTATKTKKPVSEANKLWVNLTSDNGVFNQILIGYVDGATDNDDGLYYDAPKLIVDQAAVFYSQIENSDKTFVIQGKAASSLNEEETIALGFKTNIDVPTLYTLSLAKIQGDFLSGSPVYLKDNLLNKVHDLSVSDYTFTSEVGEFNERFVIGFSNNTLSTDTALTNDSSLKIVALDNDYVQFSTSNDLQIKSVAIYDLLGRVLYNFKGSNSSETYKLSNLKSAVFLAKVELSNGAVISKKAVKK